jgi:hypothetical protein
VYLVGLDAESRAAAYSHKCIIARSSREVLREVGIEPVSELLRGQTRAVVINVTSRTLGHLHVNAIRADLHLSP